jgi:DNA invertase Pin-like site-specific DNA recombinase
MNTYHYVHQDNDTLSEELTVIKSYLQSNNFTLNKTIEDNVSIKTHWSQRTIGNIIKEMPTNSSLVVFDASHLACSTSQILEILSATSEKNISLHFVKYAMVVTNESSNVNTQHILKVISKVESDFISKRTTQALARRKAAGLPLGRPKGRGNKSIKLDKHKVDIQKYLDLGISKASIAKLVDCHPQTLYDWLERNDIKKQA